MLQHIKTEPQNKDYHKSVSTLSEISDHTASGPLGVCDGKKGTVCILTFCIKGNLEIRVRTN